MAVSDIIENQPTNTNPQHGNKYSLVFTRAPHSKYWCNKVSIPGFMLGTTLQPTPLIDRNVPGDKIIYNPLVATIQMDEDLRAWQELHDWARAIGFPESTDEYKGLQERLKKKYPYPSYCDATLLVNTSAHNSHIRIDFKDIFPISIPDVPFGSQNNDILIGGLDFMFYFQRYDVIRV